MQNPIVTYPAPPYANLPITAQYYAPSQFIISNIILGITTIVETDSFFNYVIGQQVRLIVPLIYGSFQLNELTAYVISLTSSNSVEIALNSSLNVNQFIAGTQSPYPQIMAIGDVNTGYQSTTGSNIPLVTIPGSFINIS